MDVTAHKSASAARKGSPRSLFYVSILALLGSLSFFFVVQLVPPSDSICVRRNGFTPLQSAINYKWVNYADYYFPRSAYRTVYNKTTSAETERAWQDLSHSSCSPSYYSSQLLISSRFWDQYSRGPFDHIGSIDGASMEETSTWRRHSRKCCSLSSTPLLGWFTFPARL